MRWIIGDVHGCFLSLQGLLNKIGPSSEDTIYFVGDLINRGQRSVETLDFIFNYKQAKVILGNHDIALLASAGGVISPDQSPCFKDILSHAKADQWLEWLKSQLFLFQSDFIMVHAGLHPSWTIDEHLKAAKSLHEWLKGLNSLKDIEGIWKRSQSQLHPNNINCHEDYLAFALNVFTRLRMIDRDNYQIALDIKTGLQDHLKLEPWFKYFEDKTCMPIIFGHWAALGGKLDNRRIIG
ncbi:symmetrical bis(5'-nucleosyl)-tetraphosphatase, partial [bacterium]|nr:symmetrical bis(5'-nucleosyl)-tetraphosphatase [bacterium]